MTDHPETAIGPVVKLARDLREIVDMCAHLDDQAEAKANAKVDGTALAGGHAMVALAPVANIEAWSHLQDATEDTGRAYTSVDDEDDVWEPPLQTLCFWSEQWRRERGMEFEPEPHRPYPTVTTEASFIRLSLDWAWDHEPHWDDFAEDIRAARVRVENVLYAGDRAERTRIVCDQCQLKPPATTTPRLIHKYGSAEDGSEDWWRCPGCKHKFDAEGVRKAHAKMLRSEGADRWVHQIDAIGTLKAQGRPERTIRKWLADGAGSAYCDPVTHEVWVWWPDLWKKHLATQTRRHLRVV